jgi:hypothetical protein
MSTITATRRVVNPTRRTTVLFDATMRHPARRDFGRGILASRPTFTRTWTDADASWAAAEFSRELSNEPDYDRLAAIAEAQDRVERGCLL